MSLFNDLLASIELVHSLNLPNFIGCNTEKLVRTGDTTGFLTLPDQDELTLVSYLARGRASE